jgi:(S)-sulfolactate dehydrogenase
MPDIVISEFMDETSVDALRADWTVAYDPGLVDRPEELIALASQARALIVRNRTQVRGPLLDGAAQLTVVGRLGVGLDNIDLAACRARSIVVCPASGANDLAVAEYVISTVMQLFRRAYGAFDAMIAGAWPRNRLMGGETAGKILGLIGFGAIARETAGRAKALGMEVLAFDPFVPPEDPAWKTMGVQCTGWDDLLARADALSLHVPLTDGTRHMIDAKAIAKMKPGALLINAARGGVVDETALASALREGRLGGAALDVFETEPLTADSAKRFIGLSNLILTPHIAGVTEESNVRVSAVTAANVRRILKGGSAQ